MSYYINYTISISSDPFPPFKWSGVYKTRVALKVVSKIHCVGPTRSGHWETVE